MKLALGNLGAFGDLARDSTGAVLLRCERIPVPLGNPKSISALAVVINAVVDALSEFGVRHVEMPATPQRVWQAIQEARAPR